MKVLLLNMPFVSVSRPAIGISILKARLTQEGIGCSIGYANLFFAERVGMYAYELVNDKLSSAMFAGDWLFAQHLFPDRDRSAYIETLQEQLPEKGDFDQIMAMRSHIGPFLEACFDEFDIAGHDLIGFSTTFEQNLASLALSWMIKQRYPHKPIVFGGGNCEGMMGMEIHSRFPWIDYVCSGESDNSFPALVKQLSAGDSPEGLPGVIYRKGEESHLSAPSDRIHEMDRLPDPDYDDYFSALRPMSIAKELEPALLIESARGCWWGAKSHCTFCGLNGSTMAFRAKSASRVYAELERQRERYGIGRFLAVDNIMPHVYFRDLLPMLKERNPGVSLFYEIKSNLKRAQIELMRDAGVLAIQPGIESLNSHVLQLMRKGVTAIQNVQLLRLCREYGIELAWNLLYGFPGETPQDYEDTAKTIEAIYHLRPPGAVASIRLDRFSPNYDQAGDFGLVNVRPFPIYSHIYPLPEDSMERLVYFFQFEYADSRKPTEYVQPALEKIETWKANEQGDLVKRYGKRPELMLMDTRPGRKALNYPLNGVHREIYDFCDEIRSYSAIQEFAREKEGEEVCIDPFLQQLVNCQLMFQEGNQYLSLAVDPGRKREWAGEEPATF